jgi:superfamily II DNA or RNA helicase
MQMIISNRIRLKSVPDSLQEILVGKLNIVNPEYVEAEASGRSLYGINKYITNFMVMPNGDLVIPRGMRNWVVNACNEMGIKLDITDNRTLFDHKNLDSSDIKYFPYQMNAVINLVSTAPEGIFVSPAGSGKTVVGLSIIPLVGQPTLWITHTGTLANQAVERARKFLPDIGEIGMISEGDWKRGDVLTIGMVQTLVRDTSKLIRIRDKFGLVIVDECHRTPSRTFTEVVSSLNPFYLYGLTATPYRRDKLELMMFQTIGMDKTVVPIKEVEKYGGVMVPKVVCRNFNSKFVDNNKIQDILKWEVVRNNKRNKMIVLDVIREAKAGHYCIVISDRREHCEILKKEIKGVWPKTGIATGRYTKKQIGEQVEALDKGEITVLIATYSLLGEGFDAPILSRAFIAMPFRAENKVEQLVGRVQRSYKGKEDAIVYDYIDNNIGVLKSQFYSKFKPCRLNAYKRLGAVVEMT